MEGLKDQHPNVLSDLQPNYKMLYSARFFCQDRHNQKRQIELCLCDMYRDVAIKISIINHSGIVIVQHAMILSCILVSQTNVTFQTWWFEMRKYWTHAQRVKESGRNTQFNKSVFYQQDAELTEKLLMENFRSCRQTETRRTLAERVVRDRKMYHFPRKQTKQVADEQLVHANNQAGGRQMGKEQAGSKTRFQI